MGIMSPNFSGTWYPGTERECKRTLEQWVKELPGEADTSAPLCYGGIVPHAGWYFSGLTAFSVFHHIFTVSSSHGKKPELFFLFGMHLAPNSPNYIFIDEGLKTPLGIISVDMKAAQLLSGSFDFIRENARDYTQDNTMELQLPFIKFLFPEAGIVTVGVSPNEMAIEIGERAAAISEELGAQSCFIGSTDLTHYGPNYGFLPEGTGLKSVTWVKEKNDRRIVDAFLRAEPQEVMRVALASHNACCPGAAAAAIAAVRKKGARGGKLINYTTSYDIHPDSSFVGYAGVVY